MGNFPPAVFRVTLGNTGQQIDCPANRTILQAAISAGVEYPYGCASGNCGACVAKLESGDVHLLPHGDGCFSPEQKATGQTLGCRAQPRSDVTVTWLNRTRGI